MVTKRKLLLVQSVYIIVVITEQLDKLLTRFMSESKSFTVFRSWMGA